MQRQASTADRRNHKISHSRTSLHMKNLARSGDRQANLSHARGSNVSERAGRRSSCSSIARDYYRRHICPHTPFCFLSHIKRCLLALVPSLSGGANRRQQIFPWQGTLTKLMRRRRTNGVQRSPAPRPRRTCILCTRSRSRRHVASVPN